MIDINIALEGLKGLKEMAPKQFIAENYQGKGNDDAREFTETMELAIAAIEKQIPKKPTGISETWEGRVGNCPECKKFITEDSSINGCYLCLQKLDWGDEP